MKNKVMKKTSMMMNGEEIEIAETVFIMYVGIK